jgi:hypothetical protein
MNSSSFLATPCIWYNYKKKIGKTTKRGKSEKWKMIFFKRDLTEIIRGLIEKFFVNKNMSKFQSYS